MLALAVVYLPKELSNLGSQVTKANTVIAREQIGEPCVLERLGRLFDHRSVDTSTGLVEQDREDVILEADDHFKVGVGQPDHVPLNRAALHRRVFGHVPAIPPETARQGLDPIGALATAG